MITVLFFLTYFSATLPYFSRACQVYLWHLFRTVVKTTQVKI